MNQIKFQKGFFLPLFIYLVFWLHVNLFHTFHFLLLKKKKKKKTLYFFKRSRFEGFDWLEIYVLLSFYFCWVFFVYFFFYLNWKGCKKDIIKFHILFFFFLACEKLWTISGWFCESCYVMIEWRTKSMKEKVYTKVYIIQPNRQPASIVRKTLTTTYYIILN